MLGSNDPASTEYSALLARFRTLERTGYQAWTLATVTAAALVGWSVGSASPGLLLGAVLAAAIGFYPLLHARQQLKLITCYMEEFVESRAGGPQWHVRIGQLQAVPAVNPSPDWVFTALSTLVVALAITFSWVFSGAARHGELMAGITTALGVLFVLHSAMETGRVQRTDFAAVWRKVSSTRTSIAA
jgi:hypothetical protein